MNWTDKLWSSLFDWIYSLLLDALEYVLLLFNGVTVDTFNSGLVQGLLGLFQVLGASLLGVSILLAFMENSVSSQNGGGSLITTTINSIKGLAVSVGFVTVPQALMIFTSDCLSNVVNQLSDTSASNAILTVYEVKDKLNVFSDVLVAAATPPTWLLVIIIIMFIYCIMKVTLGSIKRTGILLITISVGALHIFGIPRGYIDGFSSWCKQVVAICLTHFLQNIILIIGLGLISKDTWAVGIGLMLASTEVPRIAQRFGLDTSMKANISQTVHTASSAVHLVKGLK